MDLKLGKTKVLGTSTPLYEELRAKDMERLRANFYASFDRSRVESFIKTATSAQPPSDFKNMITGSGFHFCSYRLPKLGALQICVNIADQTFLKREPIVRDWRQAMLTLKSLKISMLPPFELVEIEEQIAIILPYGDGTLTTAHMHWHPLEQAKDEFVARLAAHGFRIKDHLQFRTSAGIPFIIDLSDLGRI